MKRGEGVLRARIASCFTLDMETVEALRRIHAATNKSYSRIVREAVKAFEHAGPVKAAAAEKA